MKKNWSDYSNADFEFTKGIEMLKKALKESKPRLSKQLDSILFIYCTGNEVKSPSGNIEMIYENDKLGLAVIEGMLYDKELIVMDDYGHTSVEDSQNRKIAEIVHNMEIL